MSLASPNIASLLLVTKRGHVQAAALADEMQSWLAARHVRAGVLAYPARGDRQDGGADRLREAAQGVDAVAVLGGDGTFIGVARQLSEQWIGQRDRQEAGRTDGPLSGPLSGQSAPLLGINFGRLGFLTETPAENWRDILGLLLADKLCRVPRLLLRWELVRDGERVLEGNAVNEVVVSRGNLARVTNIHLSVGRLSAGSAGTEDVDFSGGDLGWIRADGIIVASPLGSSAYSLSARGPLVHPDVPSLLVTAVAPCLSSAPSLVLPGDRLIRLQCEAGTDEAGGPSEADGMGEAEICLTVDGQEGHILRDKDVVRVHGLPGALEMLARHPDNYLQALRRRGLVRKFAPVDASRE
jgi:NAD+ kinase